MMDRPPRAPEDAAAAPAAPEAASERVAREDLVLFINACFASTGQTEFYGSADGQQISLRFLHEYILGNYRRLYARTLAAGINHHNQGLIVKNLLAAGAPADPAQRAEEGELLLATLLSLPPQRTLHLLREVRRARINNRRTRALIREFLRRRPDPAFDAVKYRAHVRAACVHAHIRLPAEFGNFLFRKLDRRARYETPLFESFRRAHYSAEALYDLPYTIAAGLASKHAVPPAEFLSRIAPRMTENERMRLLGSAERAEIAPLDVDLSRAPLTRLCLYLLSLPEAARRGRQDELTAALAGAAARVRGRGLRLGRVAAVLDRSYSSSGSEEKRRRPLAVALGVSALLRAAATDYRALWTTPLASDPTSTVATAPALHDELMVSARGQTRLAGPLIDALAHRPELVVIVSDGYENDPPGGVETVVRLFRAHLDPQRRVSIVHLNPVFDSERFAPRALGESLPTLGLRDAEDLLTMLGFARFADGIAPLSELEDYLAARRARLVRRLHPRTTSGSDTKEATGDPVDDPGPVPGSGEAPP